jgi:hypothetical protein
VEFIEYTRRGKIYLTYNLTHSSKLYTEIRSSAWYWIILILLVLRVQRRFKRQRNNLITVFLSTNLNTEETTTLRGGRLLAVGDLSAYQQTRL